MSKSFYSLSVRHLYQKIYLNDRAVETSDLCDLAPSWTWFILKGEISTLENRANVKLKLLIRTLKENERLCALVKHVRLSWDLKESLQIQLALLLTKFGSSLRCVENITTMKLADTLSNGPHYKHLRTLDIPPPPETRAEIRFISDEYIQNVSHLLSQRLSSHIKHLTVFVDPLCLFANLYKLDHPLSLESLKIHCRHDMFPPVVYERTQKRQLSDVFNTQTLKSLTIISWDDYSAGIRSEQKYEMWYAFKKIEDLTFISVTFDDDGIAGFINNMDSLRRIKLDFHKPETLINTDSLVYKSLWKHKNSLEFVDIKMQLTHKLIQLKAAEYRTELKIPCFCDDCCDAFSLLKLLVPAEIAEFQQYRHLDIFTHIHYSSLAPYSKALDLYPSVNTGEDTIQGFIDKFNKVNSIRRGFPGITRNDFFMLYRCLLHSMKDDVLPFVEECPRLDFLVMNSISFMVRKKGNRREAYPLFHLDHYSSNF